MTIHCATRALTTFALFVSPAGMPAARAQTLADRVITYAKQYLGVPYKFGANYYTEVPRYFDCSAFSKWVFAHYGFSLMRTSGLQATQGTYVSRGNLQKGDLVFFKTTSAGGATNHVAIYMGGNQIIHTYGDPGVCIRTLFGTYWGRKYVTARRMPGVTASAPSSSTLAVTRVLTSTLNVRTGPGTGYSIKGLAHADERYVQFATSGGWREIWYDGAAGWIAGSGYSSTVSGASAVKITWNSLNVRTGPGAGYQDVGNVSAGQYYARISTYNGWIKICFRGASRWIWGDGGTTVTP